MAKIQSKKKGNRNELEFAKLFSKRFNETFKRVPMSGGWATSNNLQNIREDAVQFFTGDLICPPNFRFCVEIKSRANFNFWDMLSGNETNEFNSWITQVELETKISNKVPLIIIKVNNRKPFVVFRNPDFKLNVDYSNDIKYKGYIVMELEKFLNFDNEFFFEPEKGKVILCQT